MKIVVSKLQKTLLYNTRRDVQLEHCIVLMSQFLHRITNWSELPNCQETQGPKIWCHFQVLTRISRILRFTSTSKHSTRVAEGFRNKRFECGTHCGRCWGLQVERSVAFLSTFLSGFRTWKSETQGIQLFFREPQRRNYICIYESSLMFVESQFIG